MEDLNDKVLGSNLSATEWNQVPSELQNIIEQTGQGLTNADLNQLGKGVASYVANANFYTDGDAGLNSYVLSKIGSRQSLVNYVDGMAVEFIAVTGNEGATTVNVTNLGAKDVVDAAGGALVGGEIIADERIKLKYRAGILNNFIIDVNIPAASVLTGSITTWPVIAIPTGYLECDGTSILRSEFNDLFLVLGVTYGNVDGNTFNLPDLRGEFIRGFDNGAGNDPDAGGRTSRGDTPATTGDNVGTKQADEFESHTHLEVGAGGSVIGAGASFGVNTQQTGATGGSNFETRPRNVYMMYIIKT